MLNVEVKKKIAEIARQYEFDFVVLFGSLARGTARAGSDVDIAVFSKKPADISLLTEELGNLFKRNDVEVADLLHASPFLMRAVAEDGILIFESRPGCFNEWKIYARNVWFETTRLRNHQKVDLKSWADNYIKQNA